MSNADADPLVYVRLGGGGNHRVYHTDESCRYLQKANRVGRKRLSVVPHRAECRGCSGKLAERRPDGRNRSHYDSLLAAAEGGDG